MNIICQALMCHDTLVIASPLYFYSVSAQMKTVIDRLHTPLRNSFLVSRTMLLAVGASTRSDMFDSLLTQYKLILSYFHLTSIGVVLVQNTKDKGSLPADVLGEAFKIGAPAR